MKGPTRKPGQVWKDQGRVLLVYRVDARLQFIDLRTGRKVRIAERFEMSDDAELLFEMKDVLESAGV
jgi:hypothetical protein